MRYALLFLVSSCTFNLSAAQGGMQRVSPPPGMIYTSSDSGFTWTLQISNLYWYAVASSADGRKLVAVDYGPRDRRFGGTRDSNGGRIYTSTNSGATWTAQFTNRFWTKVASSADGTRVIAGTFGAGLYVSDDSGVTWKEHEPPYNWSGVASSADGRKLVATPFGNQIRTSSDFGATWTKHDIDRLWVSVASSADGTRLAALTQGDDRILTSTNSGETWTVGDKLPACHAIACSADAQRLIVAAVSGKTFTSSDFGVTWTPRDGFAFASGFSVACSADGRTLATPGIMGRIMVSRDFGESWVPTGTNAHWVACALSADGAKLVALANASESAAGEVTNAVSTTRKEP